MYIIYSNFFLNFAVIITQNVIAERMILKVHTLQKNLLKIPLLGWKLSRTVFCPPCAVVVTNDEVGCTTYINCAPPVLDVTTLAGIAIPFLTPVGVRRTPCGSVVTVLVGVPVKIQVIFISHSNCSFTCHCMYGII